MNLKFKENYLSITQFNDVELNNFSVFTGLNGSGKTHLLQAIKSGKVQIEGILVNEIVYLNYNDFSIKPETNHRNQQGQDANNIIHANKNTLFQAHAKYKQNISEKISAIADAIDRSLSLAILNSSTDDFDSTIGNKEEFDIIKTTEIKNQQDIINLHQKKIISQRFSFFLQNIFNKYTELNLDYEITKKKYAALKESLTELAKNINSSYYDFIANNLNKDKSVFNLSEDDFENISPFAFELANEIKNYSLSYYQNNHNRFRFENGENVKYLSKEEFIKKHGTPPLELFNEILTVFECNGYYIQSNDWYPSPGQSASDVAIPIHLFHKEKGYTTNISNLSSGEQTLLSIALMAYKARKGNIFPRVLLLDEIDSALHPSVIERLLYVLHQIFVKGKKMKIIMATHSPTTVAHAAEDSIYIVNKVGENKIIKKPQKEAIEFLTEGFATLENGLKLFDSISKVKTSIITEGDNAEYLKKANSFFGNKEINIVVGAEGKSGKDQLKTLFSFFTKVKHDKKVVFAWDCDVPYKLMQENNTFPYIFSQCGAHKVKNGIENLFPDHLFTKDFYDSKSKPDGGELTNLNKRKFKEHIIANGTKEDYKNFKDFFDWVKSLD